VVEEGLVGADRLAHHVINGAKRIRGDGAAIELGDDGRHEAAGQRACHVHADVRAGRGRMGAPVEQSGPGVHEGWIVTPATCREFVSFMQQNHDQTALAAHMFITVPEIFTMMESETTGKLNSAAAEAMKPMSNRTECAARRVDCLTVLIIRGLGFDTFELGVVVEWAEA
jgi:hypothetical protein